MRDSIDDVRMEGEMDACIGGSESVIVRMVNSLGNGK